MMNNMKDVENTTAMIALRVFGDDDDGQVLLEVASCRDCDHSLIWLLKIFQRTNKYNLAGVHCATSLEVSEVTFALML